MRYTRVEHAKVQAVQDDLARAEADYQRLRHAWLRMSRDEPDNEVGLAMVGADMQRAHVRLQGLTGPRSFAADGARPGGQH